MTNEELLAAINRRFDDNECRWDENRRDQAENRRLFAEQRGQLEEQRKLLEENGRHADVRFEGVNDQMKQVAEGIASVDEKLERFRAETTQNFARVDERLVSLEVRVANLEAG